MDDRTSNEWLAHAVVTAHIPWYEMGSEATRLLIERIEGGARRPLRHITVPIGVKIAGAGAHQ
jgi:DNA-binding LacI/PurR family transcriptional regulator